MCERVTVGGLATTDMTAGQAYAGRRVQSTLRTRGAVNFKHLTVRLLQMWAFIGFYASHSFSSLLRGAFSSP